VPLYTSGQEPHGRWVAHTLVTNDGWKNGGTNAQWDWDIGTALMLTNKDDKHIQDVVGGLGVLLNPPRLESIVSFGYPVNLNNGQTMSQCEGIGDSSKPFTPFNGWGLKCAMTGGCSGGPWIQQYGDDVKQGLQVSVNSFGISNRPGNVFGPYFTQANIGDMFDKYQETTKPFFL